LPFFVFSFFVSSGRKAKFPACPHLSGQKARHASWHAWLDVDDGGDGDDGDGGDDVGDGDDDDGDDDG
jgi:hypothetical protein